MLCQTPNIHFLVRGSAEGFSPLNSFDAALLAAGIGNTNLVKMSSIIPPRSREVSPRSLPYGALVPVAYAAITSTLAGEKIAAAVAAALPVDESKPGLIMEYSSRGHAEEVENIVRKMAAEGMQLRGEEPREIRSVAVQHAVEKVGTAFAAVVLWYED